MHTFHNKHSLNLFEINSSIRNELEKKGILFNTPEDEFIFDEYGNFDFNSIYLKLQELKFYVDPYIFSILNSVHFIHPIIYNNDCFFTGLGYEIDTEVLEIVCEILFEFSEILTPYFF